MDSKIRFEVNLIVVEAIRGRCASFTVQSGNGFGDIWWTENPIYLNSSIDELIYFNNPRNKYSAIEIEHSVNI